MLEKVSLLFGCCFSAPGHARHVYSSLMRFVFHILNSNISLAKMQLYNLEMRPKANRCICMQTIRYLIEQTKLIYVWVDTV